jgi:hypothetical protein
VPTPAVGACAWMLATGGRGVPALLRAAAPSAVDHGRLASTRPHSQPHRGHCRSVRFRGHLLGSAARSAQPARTATVWTLGQWTRLVDTGSRRRLALRTPAMACAWQRCNQQREQCRPRRFGQPRLNHWRS